MDGELQTHLQNKESSANRADLKGFYRSWSQPDTNQCFHHWVRNEHKTQLRVAAAAGSRLAVNDDDSSYTEQLGSFLCTNPISLGSSKIGQLSNRNRARVSAQKDGMQKMETSRGEGKSEAVAFAALQQHGPKCRNWRQRMRKVRLSWPSFSAVSKEKTQRSQAKSQRGGKVTESQPGL